MGTAEDGYNVSMMTNTAWRVAGLATVMMVASAACESGPQSAASGGPAATQPADAATAASALGEGYALLHGVVGQQRRVDGLFALKSPAPAVREAVSDVGSASGAMYEWIEGRREALASIGVALDAEPLPVVEAAARSTIEGKTRRALLFGSSWQRELVISQIKSTDYMAALADAIAEREDGETRAERLRTFAETMRGLNETLVGLVEVTAGGQGGGGDSGDQGGGDE